MGEIIVRSFILELYMHNNTKIYLRWNRNQMNNGELAKSITFHLE